MSYSDRNYGAGNPSCTVCGGVGYIRYDVPEDHPFFGKVFDCNCRSSQQESSRQDYMRRVGGLAHLADKTFEAFNTSGFHPRDSASLHSAFEASRQFADHPGGWLIITGGYGCGKTHLAAAIANVQIEKGGKVLFITVPDLLDHLRTSYSPSSSEEGFENRFEEVRTAPLLVLDDMGTESPTAWAQEKLYQILNHRYMAQLPTVITTNHSLDELEPRVRSRMQDFALCQRVSITAGDYRTSGHGQADSSLNALDLYGHMTFESFDPRRDLSKEQQVVIRKAIDQSKEYAQDPQGWLVFMGPYASGKTHLAAAIANNQAEQGNKVLFVTVPDLLDHLRATFAPSSHASYDKRFNEIKTTPLLVLDDLGTESATPWAREKLHQLLNYRYNARLATVITTPHGPDELERIDERLTTRLRDARLSRIVKLTVPAYLGDRQKSIP
jgi:DNA replication protein DnaC